MPIAAKQDIIDEPPALKNGRVRPITGVSPRHIPMFSKVWKVSMAEKPTQMSIFI